MKFFIPEAISEKNAEDIYNSICVFNRVKVSGKRIYKMVWRDRKTKKVETAEIGKQAPILYGGEIIIAILQWNDAYLICTPNRGVIR